MPSCRAIGLLAALVGSPIAVADTGDPWGMAFDPETCTSGERVEVSVFGRADSGLSYTWYCEVGGFDDYTAQTTYYTCPPVTCPDQTLSLYVVVIDADGNQSWAFGDLPVTCDADTGISDTAGSCGCAGKQASSLPFALATLALATHARHRARTVAQ